jgi:hypothetical protein
VSNTDGKNICRRCVREEDEAEDEEEEMMKKGAEFAKVVNYGSWEEVVAMIGNDAEKLEAAKQMREATAACDKLYADMMKKK